MTKQAKSNSAPWTDDLKAQMRADPSSWPMVWLLTDHEGCRMLSEGIAPEDLAQQAERALGTRAQGDTEAGYRAPREKPG